MTDVDTELLLLAGRLRIAEEQQNDFQARLDELDEPIKDIRAKLDILLDDAAQRPSNFHWPDLKPEDRQERWTCLLEWVQNVLCARYPLARGALRECWWRHEDAVDSVTAAWLTWLAAYRNKQAPATDAGNWHKMYLPAVIEQVNDALSSCTRGKHEPNDTTMQAMSTVPTSLHRD